MLPSLLSVSRRVSDLIMFCRVTRDDYLNTFEFLDKLQANLNEKLVS